MIQNFEHSFNIGDEVYHKTPDSDRGIIIDIKYSKLANKCQYVVSFGRLEVDQILCYEFELSKTKIF